MCGPKRVGVRHCVTVGTGQGDGFDLDRSLIAGTLLHRPAEVSMLGASRLIVRRLASRANGEAGMSHGETRSETEFKAACVADGGGTWVCEKRILRIRRGYTLRLLTEVK